MTKTELASRVALNIRRRRKALGLSIGALADRADVGEDYLGHIEHARKLPSLEVVAKVASGLGVGLEDLVRKGGEPTPSGSTTRRLQNYLSGLSEAQKADVLAILTKLKRAERVRALRTALGA